MIEVIFSVIITTIVVFVFTYLLYSKRHADSKASIENERISIDAIVSKRVTDATIDSERRLTEVERNARERESRLLENISNLTEKFNNATQETVKIKSDMEIWKANKEKAMQKRIRDARDDALKRSRSVLKGKIGEQLAPIFDIFPFDVADARFIGSPIDFIIFNGYSDDDIKDIAIVEIKTGNSRLSKREKQIKKAVENGEVKFLEINIDEGFEVVSEFIEDKFNEDAE